MPARSQHDPQELLRMSIGPACHELRSPLAVVYGFARMLEGGGEIDVATRERYVKQIVSGAERLDHMLDDLSRIGRIAAGRVHPQMEQVSIRTVVDDVAADASNEHRLVVDDGADVTVKADPMWLRDALQATIDGLCFEEGIDLRLSWRHEPHELQLHLVPNSSFPMIDVEPDKSGLGISLARIRVVAMGGEFDGSGERVVITLPRA